MPSVEIKGTAVHDSITGARKRLGDAAFERILAGLSPEHRAALEEPILVTSWYSLDAFIALLETVILVEDGGMTANFSRRAEALVERHMTGIYPQFSRLGSPEELLRRIASGSRLYYRGAETELVRAEAGQAVLRLRGFSARHRLMQSTIEAFYRKGLELSGAAAPSARFTAPMEDGRDAEITLRWR